MKQNTPYSKALVWLSGLVALLVLSHIGPDLLQVTHRDPTLASVVGNPGVDAVGSLASDATVLLVALPLLVTAILLYAYSSADATRWRE